MDIQGIEYLSGGAQDFVMKVWAAGTSGGAHGPKRGPGLELAAWFNPRVNRVEVEESCFFSTGKDDFHAPAVDSGGPIDSVHSAIVGHMNGGAGGSFKIYARVTSFAATTLGNSGHGSMMR